MERGDLGGFLLLRQLNKITEVEALLTKSLHVNAVHREHPKMPVPTPNRSSYGLV
jgi:hypothetical protein